MSRFWTLLIFSAVTVFIINVFYHRSGPSIQTSLSNTFKHDIPDSYEKAKSDPGSQKVPYAEYLNAPPPTKASAKPSLPSATEPSSNAIFFSSTQVATSSSPSPSTSTANTKSDGLHTNSTLAALRESLKVAILESNGYHDEVVAALVHSVGSQHNITLLIYQETQRYGIQDIMASFKLPKSLPKSQLPSVFGKNKDHVEPDIVILTTCEFDLLNLATRMQALLAARKTFLFCVVHHADRWQNERLVEALLPWVEAEMIYFVTLSPHTALFLKQNAVLAWGSTVTPTIRSFAPVFPVAPFNNSRQLRFESTSNFVSGSEVAEELVLAIQGNFEPGRRDIATVFSHLEKIVERMAHSSSASDKSKFDSKKPNVTLHLIGDGNEKPNVPGSLVNNVFFDHGLSYSEFYGVISRAFATLPAFANDDYLDKKASSTVPAALIGGSPLVATQKILDAYSYLPQDAVYLQTSEATEMDVVMEILKMDEKHMQKKAGLVRSACSKIIKENSIMVGEWIAEVEMKLGR